MKSPRILWVWAAVGALFAGSIRAEDPAETAKSVLAEAEASELAGAWETAADLFVKAAAAGVTHESLGLSWSAKTPAEAQWQVRVRAWQDYVRAGNKEKLESFLWSFVRESPPRGDQRQPYYDQAVALAQLSDLCDTPEKQAAFEKYALDVTQVNPAKAAFWAGLTWFYDRQGKLEEKKALINPATPAFSQNWKSQRFEQALPAVYVLSKLGTPEAAQVLGEMLTGASEGEEVEGALSGFPPKILEPVVQKALTHGYVAVEDRAVDLLARGMGEAGVKLAREWLKHPTPKVRIGALRALRETGAPGAFASLWPLVADPAPEVRGRAILELSEIVSPNEQEFLKQKTAAGEPKEQLAAKVILTTMGEDRWVPDIVAAGEPKPCADILAVALAERPPEPLADLLIGAASSEDVTVARAACKGLARCPSKKALSHLVQLASTQAKNSWLAKAALEETPRSSLKTLLELICETKRWELMRELRKRRFGPGDEACLQPLLDMLSEGGARVYAAQALTAILQGKIEPRVREYVHGMLVEGKELDMVHPLLRILGETYQSDFLAEILEKVEKDPGAGRLLYAIKSEKVLDQLLGREGLNWAVRAALADALAYQPRSFAVPHLLKLMSADEANVVTQARRSLEQIARRELPSVEDAQKWWEEEKKTPEAGTPQGLSPARTVLLEKGWGRPQGFTPDGSRLLCFSSEPRGFAARPLENLASANLVPWKERHRFPWGYVDGERFWVLGDRKLSVYKGEQLEGSMDCQPSVSSPVYLAAQNELWAADPRRCSVSIYDLKAGGPPKEIPLAPLVGQRYLALSHRPGQPTVAVGAMGVPGGFLIDAKTKAVMPAPGLGDPWLPFRFALHSPNGQFLWSMADGRVVQFSTADGKIVKQLVLERVFATDPKIRTEIEQRQDIYRRTRLLGCTDTRLVLSVDNARLFVVDAGTGQWVECQEVPRGAPLRAFFRPGANELWVFADDRAIVYQVPE